MPFGIAKQLSRYNTFPPFISYVKGNTGVAERGLGYAPTTCYKP